MATAKQVIDMALKYIGVKENPANSNNVLFNTHYYGKPVSGKNYSWCVTFLWDAFRMAGASDLFYNGCKTAYCPSVETWGKQSKLTVPNNQGRYGDIVLFQFDSDADADHIGLIYAKNTDGSYQTIEGNTSVGNDSNGGEVMIRTRKQSVIKTIIRPKYDGSYDGSVEDAETKDSERTTFIKGVQRACGANVDGIAGKETISKTITVSARTNRTHPVVGVIQTYLNVLGYNCGAVDGIAGPKFTAAVKAYQKANGCVADGEITARNKTWKKLLGMA